MAVNITTIDPTNGSNNVPINKIISVIFTISGGPTSLDSTTLIPANFALKHTKSGQVMRCGVTYDQPIDVGGGSYTQKVYVTPNSLLFKNSSFTLKVIGLDTNNTFPTGYIKDSAGNALSNLTIVTFVTGDDIEVSDNDKTLSQQNYEGDVRLPSSVKLTQSARLQLISSYPADHSWGFTGHSITLTFNRNINTGSTTNGILLSQYPFLDEEGWYAKALVVGSGTVFKWMGADGAEAPGFFDPPIWTLATSGKTVVLSTTGQHNINTRYELNINSNLTDIAGNQFMPDENLIFTSDSYPSYITPNAIRNEINSIFDSLNLDFVHELIWKFCIEVYRLTNFRTGLASHGQFIRDYVKCSTVLSIFFDQLMPSALVAGTSKELGDFKISYAANAGSLSGDTIYQRLQKKLDKARRALVMTHLPVVAIKGVFSPTDPPNFRVRLWNNPRVPYQGMTSYPYPNNEPTNNTAEQRQYNSPGYLDNWN